MNANPEQWKSGLNDRSEGIYVALRERIANGSLRPGAQLTELGLAAEFGVSRTPVREALNRLRYDGLLERGTRAMRVRVMQPEEVLDIYEVRIALESAAARAAADRRTEFDLAKLRSEYRAMVQVDAGAADKGELSRLVYAVHFAIWNASHNGTLIDALRHLQVKVESLTSSTLMPPGRWEAVLSECRRLVEAIESRDAEIAAALATTHMTRARDVRLEIYSRALYSDETAASLAK